MHLIHESTVRQPDGIIEISLCIVNDKIRPYTYKIASEWAAGRFEFYYNKGKGLHGCALSILNRFKIKEA